MTFCDHCLLKDGLCAHLKETMKHILRNTDIDGSKLCPLSIATSKATEEGESEDIKAEIRRQGHGKEANTIASS